MLAVRGVYRELVSEFPDNTEKYREIWRNFQTKITGNEETRYCFNCLLWYSLSGPDG